MQLREFWLACVGYQAANSSRDACCTHELVR
uniref:Uncharacterized protein n=1 Tax=Caudovirales sp. ctTqA28 TaxID=2826775 RepID=A0A8S5MDI2_9CAUD|nr:MAG TPA: hypothetical protein [Caudovirales sp. ctTqA28]